MTGLNLNLSPVYLNQGLVYLVLRRYPVLIFKPGHGLTKRTTIRLKALLVRVLLPGCCSKQIKTRLNLFLNLIRCVYIGELLLLDIGLHRYI